MPWSFVEFVDPMGQGTELRHLAMSVLGLWMAICLRPDSLLCAGVCALLGPCVALLLDTMNLLDTVDKAMIIEVAPEVAEEVTQHADTSAPVFERMCAPTRQVDDAEEDAKEFEPRLSCQANRPPTCGSFEALRVPRAPPKFQKPGLRVRRRQVQAELCEFSSLDFDEVNVVQQMGLTCRMLVALKSLERVVSYWDEAVQRHEEAAFKLIGLGLTDMQAIGSTVQRAECLIEERRYRAAYEELCSVRPWFASDGAAALASERACLCYRRVAQECVQAASASECSTLDTAESSRQSPSEAHDANASPRAPPPPAPSPMAAQALPLPSLGSALHGSVCGAPSAACRPCAFVSKARGCTRGAACSFCHLCEPGELQRRKKVKIARLRADAAVALQPAAAAAADVSPPPATTPWLAPSAAVSREGNLDACGVADCAGPRGRHRRARRSERPSASAGRRCA